MAGSVGEGAVATRKQAGERCCGISLPGAAVHGEAGSRRVTGNAHGERLPAGSGAVPGHGGRRRLRCWPGCRHRRIQVEPTESGMLMGKRMQRERGVRIRTPGTHLGRHPDRLHDLLRTGALARSQAGMSWMQ